MQNQEIQGVNRSEKHPFIQKIKDLITSYIYDLMKEQFILSSVYKVKKINFFSSPNINPDSLENAENTINAFQAIPNNFSNAKKKKGSPKQEKRLTSIV